MYTPTLPEGEEDDRLDDAELEDGVKGREHLLGCQVEHDESVERQGDGQVVNEGDVQVPTVWSVERGGRAPH